MPTLSPARDAVDPVTAPPSLRASGLAPLLGTLTLGTVSLFLFWTALQSVFLALQVKRLDPAHAAGNLALVIAVGAIGALVAAPVAGMLSDRTRTRIGGRAPWLLAGLAATLVFAALLARAETIAAMALLWLAIQASSNFVFTPIMVHIPERVPLARRGIFSAAVGLSNLAGVLGGQVVGAAFAERLAAGYFAVSALLTLGILAFVAANRRSNLGEPVPPLDARALIGAFWVDPRRYPAFGWTFLGRFLFLTGFFPLKVFLLYILQDYAQLGADAVAKLPTVALAAMLGSAIGTPLAGWLSDRTGTTRPLIYACAALMIAALAIPLAFPSLNGLIAYSFLIGAGFGGFASVDYVLITKVLPSQDAAGKDLGIINMTTTLSQTLGVGLAGAAVSLWGYVVLFPLGMVFIALGTISVARIRGVR